MKRDWFFWLTAIACLAAGATAGYFFSTRRPAEPAAMPPTHPVRRDEPAPGARLAPDRADVLVLPDDVVRSLGVQTTRVVSNHQPRPLRMPGSLMLDSNRMARIHSRFEGHVMSLGMTGAGQGSRPLQFGDAVKKDQVLAVVWSKEIGQKKSELLDGYSQLMLSQATLDRLKNLKPGEVAEHVLRDAQRNYESALIAVQNGERTLRSWQLAEADIAAIHSEAERLHREGAERPASAALREGWAELAVTAPFDGVILEKNVTIGELVDPTLDLFKIADCRRLMVVANAYEEELSEIESLPPDRRRWQIALTAEPDVPPMTGSFEVVGRLIDPVQHTAQLIGWIDNPNDRFMAGQFITASVRLPARRDEVVIPTSAVIETGDEGIVFAVDPRRPNEFARRRVVVSHRGRSFAYVRTELTDDEKERGLTTIIGEERIVSSGVVLLDNAWKELSLTAASQDARLADQHDTRRE
jgi:cobalt-zinc-cadmium efflux system membrane fusion protein